MIQGSVVVLGNADAAILIGGYRYARMKEKRRISREELEKHLDKEIANFREKNQAALGK